MSPRDSTRHNTGVGIVKGGEEEERKKNEGRTKEEDVKKGCEMDHEKKTLVESLI